MTKRTPGQITAVLRAAELDQAAGMTTPQVCQKHGVGENTFHRWRQQDGGMKADDAKRPRELEAGNARLKRLVAELSLDKKVLQEVVAKKS